MADPFVITESSDLLQAPTLDEQALAALRWADVDDGLSGAIIPAADTRERVQRVALLRSPQGSLAKQFFDAPNDRRGYTFLFVLRGELSFGDTPVWDMGSAIIPPGEIEVLIEPGSVMLAASPGPAGKENSSPPGRYSLRNYFGPIELAEGADMWFTPTDQSYDDLLRRRRENLMLLIYRLHGLRGTQGYTLGSGGAVSLVLGQTGGFTDRGQAFGPGDLFVGAPYTELKFQRAEPTIALAAFFNRA